jgi:hypothetical protein
MIMGNKLPVYTTLDYTATLPLSGKVVVYRPYNVGDERNLIAAQSAKDDDPTFYINNTMKVIQGAVLNGIDLGGLPAVDVKYLLLKQRAKSVGEVIEFSIDKEEIKINIDDIYVKNERTKDDFLVDVGAGYIIKMKELSFSDEVAAGANIKKGAEYESFYNIVVASILSIASGDDIWVVGQDITPAEAKEFLFGVPKDKSTEIYEFVRKAPSLAAMIKVKGEEREVTDKEVDFLSSV